MNLDEVWRELTSAARSPSEGTLKRRLYPAGGLDLFAAVRRPSNQRVLMMKLNTHTSSAPGRFTELSWPRPAAQH
jgi:hypothetical protein